MFSAYLFLLLTVNKKYNFFQKETRKHVDANPNLIKADTVGQIFRQLAPKDLLYPVQSKYLLNRLLIEEFNMIPPEFSYGYCSSMDSNRYTTFYGFNRQRRIRHEDPFSKKFKNFTTK